MRFRTHLTRLPALFLILSGVIGCQRESKSAKGEPSNATAEAVPAVHPAKADQEKQSLTARANNALACDIYQRVRTRRGNLLFSPACVSAGLSLVLTGARGETARQIVQVMHLPGEVAQDPGASASMVQELNADGKNGSSRIRLANALWVQDGYPLLDAYRTNLKKVFALDDSRVDFARRPGEACQLINAWTETRTGGKIHDELRTEDIAPRTRLLLTTSLYLKASWRKSFYKEVTSQSSFHLEPGKTIEVPMMSDGSSNQIHGYYDGGSFQALRMPCGSTSELAMEVFLPRKLDGLAELEASLTPEALDAWRSRFRNPEEIVIQMPKYQLRTSATLNRLLSELGMPLAFEPSADFSGINGKSSDLFLAATVHSTFLDVNEDGIEAAAASFTISSDAYDDKPPTSFHADHPFFFLIRDNRSGCILFMGRVVNPLDQAA